MNKFFEALLANNVMTFLKEYFTIILFLPTLLGGLRQLYQLVSLSPSLIQFFSISQLLIDGILILIRMPLFLIGILLYGFYNAIKDDKMQRIKFWISVTIIFIGFSAFCYRLCEQENFYQLIKNFITVGTNIFFIFLYRFMGSVKTSLKALGLIISALLLSVTFDITDKQFDYKTIENISLLKEEVEIKYPNAEFKYYNDKFVIFQNPLNKRFIIKEFEDLF
ncbi:hypothetical protein PYS58_16435 [Chryseobacterium indologenes]|uniref:hypothetical protein n=1 Tax=Chryseobacterium indologenes TaxID=253 RepID=UPI0023E77E02|nr:hypothetical protein [Chryseobacterium indologenes]WET48152.1 hypothetical protein PYS58_16435 [Chryseobacterium indologenes]